MAAKSRTQHVHGLETTLRMVAKSIQTQSIYTSKLFCDSVRGTLLANPENTPKNGTVSELGNRPRRLPDILVLSGIHVFPPQIDISYAAYHMRHMPF